MDAKKVERFFACALVGLFIVSCALLVVPKNKPPVPAPAPVDPGVVEDKPATDKPADNEPTPLPLEELVSEDYTPPEMLGVPDDHMEVAAEAQSLFPEGFAVTDPEKARENSKKNIRIYEITRRVRMKGKPVGADLWCGPQQTGDCVGCGLARAKNERLGVQVFKGETIDPDLAHPSYDYGVARRHADLNGLPRFPCGSAGAYPSVAALGSKEWGWGPLSQLPAYSGSLSNKWGCSGVPAEYLKLGKENAGGDCYPIRSVDELIEAIVNLYPCTLAVSFSPGGKYKSDNRNCLRWDGPRQGGHQMCITAYDGSLGPGHEYFFVQNSHGPRAQAATEPLQGEPPGGFWVPKSQVVEWLRQRNCEIWAVSDVNGFPAEDKIDWSIFDQFDLPQPVKKELENDSQSCISVPSYGMAI